MEIQRTMRLRLQPDAATAQWLEEVMAAYTWSFNAVCRHGWDHNINNSVELHKATYYEHRSQTGLPAQLTCAARVKAAEALKAARGRLKQGKPVRCPRSKFCAIRYDARSFHVWFDRQEVSLPTLHGRVRLPFEVSAYHAQYMQWKTASSDLVRDRQGRWWLHVVMATQIDTPSADGEVVGVDLGVNNPAVDSRGRFYGSDHWHVVEQRILELRRRLQAKGTKSAKRHLKKMSGRQKRFRRDCDHVLSKRMVTSLIPGATLVFEDLTYILDQVKVRKAQRRRIHSWSFRKLQTFAQYKAEVRGVLVAFVDPRHTSQQCSSCGYLNRANRQNQGRFACKSCDFEANADVNAAVNIRNKHLKYLGSPVNLPIVSTLGSGTNLTLDPLVGVR